MQRVQNNDFPSPEDHMYAYRLYRCNKISYNEYRDVWDFYIGVFQDSRNDKLTRISRHLEKKLNRKPTIQEIHHFDYMFID